VGQQIPEQFVAGQEAEQVEHAVAAEPAGGLLFRVHPVDGFFEAGAVFFGQHIADQQESLLQELFSDRFADRLVAGQVPVAGQVAVIARCPHRVSSPVNRRSSTVRRS
jgi:hypothetical protein